MMTLSRQVFSPDSPRRWRGFFTGTPGLRVTPPLRQTRDGVTVQLHAPTGSGRLEKMILK